MNYLVYGNEEFLIDENIKKIISENNIEKNSINEIDMNNNSINSLIEILNTYDLFASKKIIIAYNIDFLSSTKSDKDYDFDDLLNYLKNPNSLSILILKINSKIDERKKITKEIKNLCKAIKCELLTDDDLFKYISNSFKKDEFRIDTKSINEIIERSNKDLLSINNELNKLKMYKYNEKNIDINDVKNLINRKIYDDVFLFVESVISNNKKKAFEIYNDLINYHNEEIIKLINLVYGQFRLIYQVTVLKNMGDNEDIIAKKLGVHPYRVKLVFKSKPFNKDILIKYIYKLCELDLNIKIGKVNKTTAFEQFLLSI